MGLQQLLTGNQLNLLECCRRLRDQRAHSVQVEIQYIYVAEALCEYGRAMKYIVDPQLLKEFEKFKESFNVFVAGLGIEEQPPPAPPCPIPPPGPPCPLPSPGPPCPLPPPAAPCPIPFPAPKGTAAVAATQYQPEQDLP
ncbi:hypothetical protein OSTOST_22986 [Ostertagia ostertagi]